MRDGCIYESLDTLRVITLANDFYPLLLLWLPLPALDNGIANSVNNIEQLALETDDTVAITWQILHLFLALLFPFVLGHYTRSKWSSLLDVAFVFHEFVYVMEDRVEWLDLDQTVELVPEFVLNCLANVVEDARDYCT